MAVHFHPLTVKEITKETPDCVCITFDVPAALKKEFTFIQGQNITLKTTINGEELRRSYSICSAPFEQQLKVAIKLVDGGKFSTHANLHLKKGDLLQVMPPTGNFYTGLHSKNIKQYVAFAAGSGITPIISIIKATLKMEPGSKFTLVFGNKSKNSIIFFEELEALKNKYLQRFSFINILSREKTDASINFGRFTNEKLLQLSSLIDYKNAAEFFICGPQQMIFCIKDYLLNTGISKAKIHFELFTAPGYTTTTDNTELKFDETAPKSNITIRLDGRAIEFKLPFNSISVLDGALSTGADLPYACKGGVCATCRAKLIEGEVKMKVNYALEQEEIDRGFILTCQSYPLTQNVVIDFDLK